MHSLEAARAYAAELFNIGVEAAHPGPAVTKHIHQKLPDIGPLSACSQPLHLIAVGKAACPMMDAARAALPSADVRTCLAVTNYENVINTRDYDVIGAGHPLPDQKGLKAAKRIASILQTAGSDDLIILLLSGGGSALLPYPIESVTLAQKIHITEQLLKSGADISEINQVRRALSRLKGGGFADLASPARCVSFILSDVPGDNLQDIASGPTVPNSTSTPDAWAVMRKYDLQDNIPQTIINALKRPSLQVYNGPAPVNILIGSNAKSVAALVHANLTFPSKKLPNFLSGDVEDLARMFVEKISQAPHGQTHVFVSGGEPTVQVCGTGLGGRNQELALRVAFEAERQNLHDKWVFLSGGTDGRDGPTNAAGAITDPNSLSRMRQAGINPEAMIQNNDSHPALHASGDLLITGGTGTNVADLQILITF